MKVEILDKAKEDLVLGYHFYEKQSAGLGTYFLDTLFSDIDSLHLYAGTHSTVGGSHRCLSRRFPFAIYYRVDGETIRVRAVLDTRQNPAEIRQRLKGP